MPAALTLHNIDDELYAAVQAYAAETKTSLGAAFKQLARRALGLPTTEELERIDAWKRWEKKYVGTFSEKEIKAMKEALEAQSQVEPEMWT